MNWLLAAHDSLNSGVTRHNWTNELGEPNEVGAIRHLSCPVILEWPKGGFTMVSPFLRVPAAGAALMTIVVAAGCASTAGAAAPGGLEKTDLTVAAVPALDSAGVYIAQQRGLFAAEGLHVKIVPAISSATVITNQLAGKYDVTSGAYPSYILANAKQHAKLEILEAGSNMGPLTQEVMVPAGSPIQSVAQLKGKKIGVNALDNIGTLLVSSMLSDNGMSPSDVHFVAIPFPLMAAALKAGTVDAAWLPEPFITGAEESIGATAIADADQGAAQSLPVAGYIVTQAWARENPNTAAAFQRAIVQAQGIANTDLGAIQQGMVAYGGVSQATAGIAAAPTFPLKTDPNLIQRVANLMQQFGMLEVEFNVSQMIGR
jgi:NitT/TauT family transport system substrate-binding protein